MLEYMPVDLGEEGNSESHVTNLIHAFKKNNNKMERLIGETPLEILEKCIYVLFVYTFINKNKLIRLILTIKSKPLNLD